MLELTVRQATIEDVAPLTDLAYSTYWDTFSAHPLNDPSDFQAYMSEAFSLEKFSTELLDTSTCFLLAYSGDVLAGYAKLWIKNSEPPIKAENPVELCRLYARKDFIGMGVGHRLMEECETASRKLGCDVIWLGVWEHNPKAISFYKKHGFRIVGSHVFSVGTDDQNDFLMQKNL